MRLAVHSTMWGLPWGASEALWSSAVDRLLDDGHEVAVRFHWEPRPSPRLRALHRRGAQLSWHRTPRERARRRISGDVDPVPATRRWLDRVRPDYVLFSVGDARDDVRATAACRGSGVPYATLLHCAGGERVVEEPRLDELRAAYAGADRTLFVSADNRLILERELAIELPHSTVVDNPLAATPDQPLPWPDEEPWRLACVGRLACGQKGQDLAVEVLARDRWRARPVTLDLWGQDHGNRAQLEALVGRHDLAQRVHFAGFSSDPLRVYRAAHALLLPSRYEGMPMVTAEAQWCGRVPIVTAVGRNPELVADGTTGFLVPAATVDLLDATLDRAWQRRSDWPEIGRAAATAIRGVYEADPSGAFAALLVAAEKSAAT